MDASPAVMLQAMKEEPPLSAKCKDKFLIQSTIITPEKETLPLQEMVGHITSSIVYGFAHATRVVGE